MHPPSSNDPNQPGLELFKAISAAINAKRNQDPFAAYLCARNERLTDFLVMVHSLLRDKPSYEQLELIQNVMEKPEEMTKLLERASEEFFRRTPDLDKASVGIEFEARDPQQKLKYMAAQIPLKIESARTMDPLIFSTAVSGMIASNPLRCSIWAEAIDTPQAMHEKIHDWVKRGKLDLHSVAASISR
jgi:hypothetical protein